MVLVEEAINLLLDKVKPQKRCDKIDILEANGCVLGEDICSPLSVPHFPKSGMDGYAIKSADSSGAGKDTPITLKVLGEVLAGDDKKFEVEDGTTVRIMTGGEVPEGYDCVVKQEDTNYGEEFVEIYKPMEQWENYCKVGEDIIKGELVMKKHTRLTCSHIGVLTSMGISSVSVLSPLKVGIISTGSEIIRPEEPIGPAKVYSSSSYTIASFLKSQNVDVKFMELCIDEVDLMCEKVMHQIDEIDILITTGAVSVGKKDIIPEVLKKIGAELIFKKVNMKPGTPVLSSCYRDKIILSFSGNPFACFTNFQIFFWPILAKFMQNKTYQLKKAKAVISEGTLKSSGLRRFVRAYEEDGEVRLVSNKHFSSVMSNILECNCLIDQKAKTEIKVGDVVDILYIKNSMAFI
jgi:molybdopterin molybdotransferase